MSVRSRNWREFIKEKLEKIEQCLKRNNVYKSSIGAKEKYGSTGGNAGLLGDEIMKKDIIPKRLEFGSQGLSPMEL
jgi:hypothetical protein